MAEISDETRLLIEQRERENYTPLQGRVIMQINRQIAQLEKRLSEFPVTSEATYCRNKILDEIIKLRKRIENGCICPDDYPPDDWRHHDRRVR